ncbi:MAG TPA: glycosyltransferase family 9 protein [Rhodanobacteraceae bacterium]|nr:glycosyltransferase family 9 protein [Rhodanobacteraceae bacterium]
MTAQRAPGFSTGIEDIRRRVTARMMRGVFRAGSVSGTRLPRTGIHRVLICRSVHTLGDSLTLTPLLMELADSYPGAEVDIVCGCPIADALFETFPNVRAIHRVPRHVAGHLLATAGALHAMRRKHYDLVIDPDPQSQSGRLLALSAHATYSLGYVGPNKSGTLTHGVAIPAGLCHKAMTPVYLLRRAIGEDPAAREYPQPRLVLTNAELECGRRTLARLTTANGRPRAGGARIGVFANATRDKLLAGDWWRVFIDAFRTDSPGCRIVEILPVFGKSMLEDRFACFYSSDIRKLAALIANLDAYVSADCGVMHLAWATGTPTVGLFNVTNPSEWGPFGPRMGALPLDDATPVEIAHRTTERLGLPNA